ncbi:hypothetical protein GW17_00020563 [Ensete ventricosum]|nr:hypothetical protein GW17_00020563 [Ensete ventricosum]
MQSWGLGWKRPSEVFHLALDYGESDANADDDLPSCPPPPPPSPLPPLPPSPPQPLSPCSLPSGELGFRIDLDWTVGDDEDQIALRLHSQLMVSLHPPQDTVVLDLHGDDELGCVRVEMKVIKRREPLRSVRLSKVAGSGQQNDGAGVLTRLIRSNLTPSGPADGVQVLLVDHWKSVTVLSLCGCGLWLYGRAMAELRVLRLFGNPLEFLPEILPLHNLRHLSLANIRIEATENLKSVNVHIEVEQACFALSSLAADVSLAMQLIKSDIMKPIELLLRSIDQEELTSVLQVLSTLAFASDSVAQKMMTKDVLKPLKALCAHKSTEVRLFGYKMLYLCNVYHYWLGTPELPSGMLETPAVTSTGTTASGAQIASRRGAFIGSCKHRARKGGWRYLDTGQVLIESACSVDRVEDVLETLLPMIPEVQYFRFNPERIIICTGKYGLAPSLVKAFLDSGAKAVVSSSIEPPDVKSIQFRGTSDYNGFENGRFEIGDEDGKGEQEPVGPASDWEDGDGEKGGEHQISWNGDYEEDLSEFVCHLYDALFREGSTLDVALQHALCSHPKLRYRCHLPNTL